MSHALSSNTESFLSSALTTVIAAAALAIGIITATIATKLVTKIYGNILTGIKQKKENT
jgi:hypothetical protein